MVNRILSLAIFSLLMAPAGAQTDLSGADRVVTNAGPSIVTIKTILKTETTFGGESQAQESRLILQGAIVSPDGLIMISNLAFSPYRAMALAGMGDEPGSAPQIKTTPTSMKVIIGNEDAEYDAFLAATDTNLDLAFIKIEKLGDRTLPFIDFGASTSAITGQTVVQICRLGREYDYTPYYQSATVNGEIKKPRAAWMLQGSVSTLGLPVFAITGQVIGVLTVVTSGAKEQGAAESFGLGMFMRMISGGGGGAPNATFVIPATVIKGVVEQARLRAVEVAAQRAAKRDTKPAQPEKPAAKPSSKSKGK